MQELGAGLSYKALSNKALLAEVLRRYPDHDALTDRLGIEPGTIYTWRHRLSKAGRVCCILLLELDDALRQGSSDIQARVASLEAVNRERGGDSRIQSAPPGDASAGAAPPLST